MSRSQPQASSIQSSSFGRNAIVESDDDTATTSTGSRPLSRNAQAQARLRARRKAYVDSLEGNVKRLQAIVDALSITSNRHVFSSPGTSSSPGDHLSVSASPQSESQMLEQLQLDNGRLRRERDALRVQLDALLTYISKGGVASAQTQPNSEISNSQGHSGVGQSEIHGAPSPSFIQIGPYTSSELVDMRAFSPVDLAALQEYLNMSTTSPQYPEYSSEATPSASQAFEVSMAPIISRPSSSVDLSAPLQRGGSSDGSDRGGAFRL